MLDVSQNLLDKFHRFRCGHPQSTHIIMAGRLSTWRVETSPPFTSGPKTQSMQESGRYRMRTFSWRLNERIIVCSVPRNDSAEGSFGRMKMESVHPGHWEERTRDEVLVPVDDCIRWYDHERIKRSLGWMSPVQYRQSQGMAA